jgi:putative toxin-antitoxin system antitoxin component (TIGR02293 family)
MKKKTTSYATKIAPTSMVQEPAVAYITTPLNLFPKKKAATTVLTKTYTYKNFKRVLDKAPFTLAEWADLLYMSERTLQRYAKNNAEFSGLQIERILQLEKLIDFAIDSFGTNFKAWLMKGHFYFNGATPFSLLATSEGITEVHRLLGRIQYGTSA